MVRAIILAKDILSSFLRCDALTFKAPLCVGCKYEISTKSTLYLLIAELNRMSTLHKATTTTMEKNKYKTLITTVLLPKMDEMLCAMQEHYGDVVAAQYHKKIEEYVQC